MSKTGKILTDNILMGNKKYMYNTKPKRSWMFWAKVDVLKKNQVRWELLCKSFAQQNTHTPPEWQVSTGHGTRATYHLLWGPFWTAESGSLWNLLLPAHPLSPQSYFHFPQPSPPPNWGNAWKLRLILHEWDQISFFGKVSLDSPLLPPVRYLCATYVFLYLHVLYHIEFIGSHLFPLLDCKLPDPLALSLSRYLVQVKRMACFLSLCMAQ